ncbi:MAG: (d)CMP kinase [Phycisphaerales bacterium]|nr:(d)CMP kinase [Phycisphaerales bacterium]
MIITIDGPAGSGKSAAAVLLARKLGFAHLDTGAMYRAVALAAMQCGALRDGAAMAKVARDMRLAFDAAAEPARVLLNGQDVTDAIRTREVTQATRQAADNPDVRSELVRRQQRLAEKLGNVVSEGRDQGSVAFPNAEFKFFLDADVRVRAKRRQQQLAAGGLAGDADGILRDMQQRDREDRSRPVGPLVKTADAIIIDATDLTLEQVVDRMTNLVRAGKAIGAVGEVHS